MDNSFLPIILGWFFAQVALFIAIKVEDWINYRRYKKDERAGLLITSEKLRAEFREIYKGV